MATITQIEIEGFKAFPKNFKLDLGIGKNLLIYGENGSGKSSLYYALHVLLQSVFKDDKGAKYFKPGDTNGEEFIINNEHLINIFRFNEAKDNTYTPYVRITFDDGKVWRLDNGGLSSENGGDENEIKMLNKNSAFINHSYISRFHAARNSEEIDLWNVFYKDILPFHLPAEETQFLADLYNEIVSECNSSPKPRTSRNSLKKKIVDFNSYLELLVGNINKRASSIYNNYFRSVGDHELTIKIAYYKKEDPENINKDNYQLYYGRDITGLLELNTPKIGIEVKENGELIFKPQSHFNEAKLTAIALAVRFAAMTTTVITQGSFLALDDMLISLDMSNRTKVVDFLLKISDKYKIYLFTHDKMFFEYFKHKTKKNQDEWVYKEIYIDDEKTPYIRNSEDYLGEAEHYIKQHHYEIAGNFLRKAAELLCKNFLPNKWQLSTDYSRLDLNGLIHNSKRYAEESGMTDISVFEELDSFRKFILNPASHDSYDVVKYRYEVELCLQTLMVFKDIDSVPFLNRGDKLCFELKCKAPTIDIYKFELILCDNFRIIKQPGKTPLLSKGMINYRVIKNGEVGTMQSDNTTIKSFYDKCYEKSDKSKDANFFNSVIEAKSGNAICTFI
ncbi:MAG: AAA family ATPase [Bacteroidales bacterium]|nr:AAA family ATPase [Bacteroidales bacterium]